MEQRAYLAEVYLMSCTRPSCSGLEAIVRAAQHDSWTLARYYFWTYLRRYKLVTVQVAYDIEDPLALGPSGNPLVQYVISAYTGHVMCMLSATREVPSILHTVWFHRAFHNDGHERMVRRSVQTVIYDITLFHMAFGAFNNGQFNL